LKHYLIFIIAGSFFFLTLSCDSPSSPADSNNALLRSLSINPNLVQFGPQSLIGDTTLTIDIVATTEQNPSGGLVYSIERDGELIADGNLELLTESSYSTQFSTTVNTSANFDYTIYVFQSGTTSAERLQGRVRIRGRNVSPPVIVEANNTEEATIPTSGNQRIDFFARVVHPNGQELIDRVNFFFINESGERTPASSINDFRMLDNGVFNEVEGFIDEAEGDSLYSRAFFINSTNSPDEITVNYYAIGSDGQSSDTLQTSLSIVE